MVTMINDDENDNDNNNNGNNDIKLMKATTMTMAMTMTMIITIMLLDGIAHMLQFSHWGNRGMMASSTSDENFHLLTPGLSLNSGKL